MGRSNTRRSIAAGVPLGAFRARPVFRLPPERPTTRSEYEMSDQKMSLEALKQPDHAVPD